MIGCFTPSAGCSHKTSAKNAGLDELAAQGESHSARDGLNANEQAGICLGFWAEFTSKQTEYTGKCARLRVYISNKTFGDGANEARGDWKREIKERREEGRREQTRSEY